MNIGKIYEGKFRELMKKEYNLIIRVPDYAATGISHSSICDFQCINDGITDYYEVKHSYNKKSFPLVNITNSQISSLRKIWKIGKVKGVYIFIFMVKKKFRIHIKNLLEFIETNSRKSIPIEWLQQYIY